MRALRREHQYEWFTALDDISFSVGRGEVVGIIGTNGSGKSTLLKIVSGALIPTSGRVLVDRDKVQLLTLGTGFDMELTGRENVYLNGALIGYTKAFLDEKYSDIVRFAELEGFMEEKVRNYSSGHGGPGWALPSPPPGTPLRSSSWTKCSVWATGSSGRKARRASGR